MVDADVRRVIVGVDQAGVLGSPLVHICNVSIGRVMALLLMSTTQHERVEEPLTVKKSNWLKRLEGL